MSARPKLVSNRSSGTYTGHGEPRGPAKATAWIVLECDGACGPRNPGGCGTWGWVAYEAGLIPTAEAYGFGALGKSPEMSNSIAEYQAVISALEWALANGRIGVLVRSDSQLVVNQVNGQWRCNKPHLQELRDRVQCLLEETDARIQWVPRERNEAADKLSRKAYREWCRTHSAEPVIRVRAAA